MLLVANKCPSIILGDKFLFALVALAMPCILCGFDSQAQTLKTNPSETCWLPKELCDNECLSHDPAKINMI